MFYVSKIVAILPLRALIMQDVGVKGNNTMGSFNRAAWHADRAACILVRGRAGGGYLVCRRGPVRP